MSTPELTSMTFETAAVVNGVPVAAGTVCRPSQRVVVESPPKASYRLARRADGELVLQGLWHLGDGVNLSQEWRDVETVSIPS